MTREQIPHWQGDRRGTGDDHLEEHHDLQAISARPGKATRLGVRGSIRCGPKERQRSLHLFTHYDGSPGPLSSSVFYSLPKLEAGRTPTAMPLPRELEEEELQVDLR
ncbi:hypothetical protein Syun_001706 [Stephania yunnanensis]|uniref:Uncharacterized protein n=1 Tax=Stephania yunnanensis TaxID=152371 RepID=A0AAP0LEE4_9MAGN